jgi:hypothetical protein
MQRVLPAARRRHGGRQQCLGEGAARIPCEGQRSACAVRAGRGQAVSRRTRRVPPLRRLGSRRGSSGSSRRRRRRRRRRRGGSPGGSSAAARTRLLGDQRQVLGAGEHVDERRLAHVGAADDGELWEARRRALGQLGAALDERGGLHAAVRGLRQAQLQRGELLGVRAGRGLRPPLAGCAALRLILLLRLLVRRGREAKAGPIAVDRSQRLRAHDGPQLQRLLRAVERGCEGAAAGRGAPCTGAGRRRRRRGHQRAPAPLAELPARAGAQGGVHGAAAAGAGPSCARGRCDAADELGRGTGSRPGRRPRLCGLAAGDGPARGGRLSRRPAQLAAGCRTLPSARPRRARTRGSPGHWCSAARGATDAGAI